MRHLVATYQNQPRLSNDIVEKENMRKNAVRSTPSKNLVVPGVKAQTPLTLRRLNNQSLQYNREKKIESDDASNEDFSFKKLRGAAKDFEKQQLDRLIKGSTTNKLPNSNLTYNLPVINPDLKDTDAGNMSTVQNMIGYEILMRDTDVHENFSDENKYDSFEKQFVERASDMKIGTNKLDVRSLEVLKEKSSANVDNIKKLSLVVRDKHPKHNPYFISNTTKQCNGRPQENLVRSFSSHPNLKSLSGTDGIRTPRPSPRKSTKKARILKRRPMPEGDRITTDGGRISLSIGHESSARSMPMMCQDKTNFSDVGLRNKFDRGGPSIVAHNFSTSEYNSQSKTKQRRVPDDSNNDEMYLTGPEFTDENDAASANNPEEVLSSHRQDSQVKRNLCRLPNHSSQIKGRCFNPNLYKFTPKIKKEEVEATDNKHASVQKISQWLGSDPFGKGKKMVYIRQGTQIMTKSKAFEHEDVVQMRKKGIVSEKELQHFPAGKVSKGKKWLQAAFIEGKEEEVRSSVFKKKEKIESVYKQVN